MTRARAAPVPRAREPHRYSLTPKWSVTIADAEVRRCPKCGYFEVVIPNRMRSTEPSPPR
jgi:hypothetical protein